MLGYARKFSRFLMGNIDLKCLSPLIPPLNDLLINCQLRLDGVIDVGLANLSMVQYIFPWLTLLCAQNPPWRSRNKLDQPEKANLLVFFKICDDALKLGCQCECIEGVDPVAEPLVRVIIPLNIECIEKLQVISDRLKI